MTVEGVEKKHGRIKNQVQQVLEGQTGKAGKRRTSTEKKKECSRKVNQTWLGHQWNAVQ